MYHTHVISHGRWRLEGACCHAPEADKKRFYGVGRPADRLRRKYCANCPVSLECLKEGTIHDEEGLWGGLSKSERRNLPYFLLQGWIAEAVQEKWFFRSRLDPAPKSGTRPALIIALAQLETTRLLKPVSPVVAVLTVAHLAIFPREACEDSSVFQFVRDRAVDNYQNNTLQRDS